MSSFDELIKFTAHNFSRIFNSFYLGLDFSTLTPSLNVNFVMLTMLNGIGDEYSLGVTEYLVRVIRRSWQLQRNRCQSWRTDGVLPTGYTVLGHKTLWIHQSP